ncbi:polar amino acid transport system substrate-binding protein [Arthrobacter stackebrandtii]|uniref:Polar amino acid transport system substrate-binding protein n=1 Tax=Arthrobacter stackebrandtii TaxID=272161 RepID=A0ABS4YUC2_9MICC|nr:transporter substrate-binding domain-containing protein [Arthrobacter stackebrandtii]MBP2412017.1 polar amino acid transport system substrate-binding protein [Arthrobacter stackebrandtii]
MFRTSSHARGSRVVSICAILASSALMLSACGGTNAATNTSESPAAKSQDFDQALHDALPAAYKGKKIKVGAFNDWPPDEFMEDGQLKGWSIDMAAAIFGVLGVDYSIEGTTFESVIPGLATKRYDAGFASFGVTPDRLKSLDFIPQRKEGTAYGSLASAPIKVDSTADLCGHSVAVLTGAWDYQYLLEESKKNCSANPIDLKQFTTQNDAELAVSSKRVEIVAAGSAKLLYSAKQTGTTYVSDLLSNPVYNGIGVTKGNPLGESIRSAIQVLIDNGRYKEVLDKWGVGTQGLLEKAVLVTENNPNP